MLNLESACDQSAARRPPWNKGKLIGAKPPLEGSRSTSLSRPSVRRIACESVQRARARQYWQRGANWPIQSFAHLGGMIAAKSSC